MIRNAVARVKRYESLINIRNQGGTAEFSSLVRGVFLFDRKLLYFLSNKNPPGDARSRDKKMSLMRPRSAREFRERNSLFFARKTEAKRNRDAWLRFSGQ